MTRAPTTIDTALPANRLATEITADKNLRLSVTGEHGVGWLMKRMEARGITSMFFDPMPGVVRGPDRVTRMLEPIMARGHGVQVHFHTERLEWFSDSPVDGCLGRHIGDFALEGLTLLTGRAQNALIEAEAAAGLRFAASQGQHSFVVATHSFEMLSHDRLAPSRVRTDPRMVQLAWAAIRYENALQFA